MKMVVPDEEIVRRIIYILERADLTTITTANIRRQLEEDFGTDLSDKKAFIRDQVELYLQLRQQHEQHFGLRRIEHFHPQFHQARVAAGASTTVALDDIVHFGDFGIHHQQPDARAFQYNFATTATPKASIPEKKKRTGGGLIKPCGLSQELQAIVGERELSRIQVVKMLWVYIREKNLQDPENRRKIICDDALRALLGCESTDMFQMNKLLAKHIWPLESPRDSGEPKPKKTKADKSEFRESRFMAPHPLSEALINFLGTGESELPRTEVVKRIWDYIKGNQLQDPADKRRIVCDSKLRELLGCDTFNGFGMAKYLSPHFIKSSS